MQRVNWGAKSDYEYVQVCLYVVCALSLVFVNLSLLTTQSLPFQNYKLLQVAFTKNRVARHIDVDKLIRGKYQGEPKTQNWQKYCNFLKKTRKSQQCRSFCRQLGILPVAQGVL